MIVWGLLVLGCLKNNQKEQGFAQGNPLLLNASQECPEYYLENIASGIMMINKAGFAM